MLNLKKNNSLFLKSKKKKYNFYNLECSKGRIKFKLINNILLIKVNNNTSILIKKKKTINLLIKDNKFRCNSKNIKDLNNLSKKLFKFCTQNLFL